MLSSLRKDIHYTIVSSQNYLPYTILVNII